MTEFIAHAGKGNRHMPPYWCLEKIEHTLGDRVEPIRGSRIVLIGVACKPGMGDTRESPAQRIAEQLLELGADLAYHDPHVPDLPSLGLSSRSLDELLPGADLAVIVTAHPDVDHVAIEARVPLLDLQGVLRPGRTPTASAKPRSPSARR